MMVSMQRNARRLGAVIPIYKPSEEFFSVLSALESQTYPVSQVIVIDSSPIIDARHQKIIEDYCGHLNCMYLRILPEEFDHGKTRNLGVSKLKNLDAVLFLTQDAIMSRDCVEKLLIYINVNALAGAYARQLPREGATELEVIERRLTYTPTSRINTGSPRGIDDVLMSNACSMIRIDAFATVGGFPEKIITAEDIVLANKLLQAGYRTGYCAEATIMHSHNLSFTATVRRYFDTGVMHQEWGKAIPFNTARGKGAQLVKNELKHILRNKPTEFLAFLLSVLGKLTGYYLGKHHVCINRKLRYDLSQNKGFWGDN